MNPPGVHKILMGKYLFLSLVILVTVVTVPVVLEREAHAYDSVPEKIQAILMLKVLGFIQELGGQAKSDVTLGVLGGGSVLLLMEGALAGSKLEITIKDVKLSNLEGIQILFIPGNTGSDLVRQAKSIAKGSKILTVGGDPQFVLEYDLTLSFHLKDGKPRILINAASIAEEGVKFSSRLMAIADIEK